MKNRASRRWQTASLAGIALAFFSVGAQAAALDAQTGTASPDRAEQQFNTKTFTPTISPRIEVKQAAIQTAPKGAEKVTFVLNTLKLEGVTAYKHGELEKIYADKIGQKITLADLYTIAADLTRKYRNDGYILTQIVVPPQTIEKGTARLQVVEGFIANVEVRGAANEDQGALELMRGIADHVHTGNRAVNVRELERALLLINDLPGVSARGVLASSKTTPGAADLLIITERKSFNAEISADNFGTKFLGPFEVGASGSLNSPFGHNERITAQYEMAPEWDLQSELYYFSLAYDQTVSTTGTKVSVFGSDTFTNPGYTLDEFDVSGKSQFMGVQVSQPFIRTRNLNFSGRATFDMRDVATRNNIEETRKDHIRALRVGSRIEYLDTFLGVAYNALDLQVSKGLPILGATNGDDPNVSRADANASFLKFNGEIQRLQRVTSNVNLLLAATGQWADDALLSSEEFGVGGQSYGRGYDPSEVIGDRGYAGKVELQWTKPYTLNFIDSYQLYSFYDAGTVWNIDPDTLAGKRDSVASAGLGVRADINASTQAGVSLTFPLTRDVSTLDDHDPRWFANISRKF